MVGGGTPPTRSLPLVRALSMRVSSVVVHVRVKVNLRLSAKSINVAYSQ